MNHRSFFLKLLASTVLTVGASALWQSTAIAAPSLTIQPIGWNVVGLDSNKVTDGPNQYLDGARVCNVGDTAATNVTTNFIKDGGSSFINLIGGGTLSIASLPAGATSPAPGNTGSVPSNCYDFYFNVQVTRSTSAYSTLTGAGAAATRQQFHIEATATGLGTLKTPTNRELYVEKLVSQNRNAVDSITGPTSVYVGQTVQYTVTGHTAPGGYEQLVFSPVLPVFFQVVSVSTTYTAPTGATNNTVYGDACGWVNDTTSTDYHNNGACNLADQYAGGKVGDNVTTVYTIKVLSTGSGSLTNIIYDFSGSSYHYNSDYGTGINTYTVTALPSSADLSITKTDGQTTAIPGNPISYTITVTNNGPSPVSSLTLTDSVDARILNPVFTPSTGTYTNSTGAWTGLNLAAGQSITLTVSGTVSAAATGTLTNTATVAPPSGTPDSNTANNSSTDTDTLTPSANLSLTKTHSGSFTVGQNGTYTLTVANSGPSASGALTVTDTLPTGLSFVSGVGTGWSCSASGQTITCTNSGGLTAGANSTIALTVGVSAGAAPSVTNTATVSSTASDPNPANNTANDPTTVTGVPDLTIAKSHSGSFTQGTTGSYTLVATNSGSVVTSGTVTVSDTLPIGLTPTIASGTGWNCSISGQTVTCTRSDVLAAGASYPSLSLTVAVAANAANVTNTATVTGGGQTNTTNDSASDPTTVMAATDLSITKTDGQTSTTPGSPIAYTITVTNNGPSTVNSVTVNDTVPAAIQSPVFTPSTGSYNSGTGAWTGLTLASGQSITLTVSGTVATSATGTITNTATVSPPSGTADTNSANNSATDTTTIAAMTNTDLSITKTDGQTSTTPGSAIAYTITVTNNGPSTVNSVTVNDTVPAAIQSPVFTPSTGSYTNSTGAWTGLNLASGQSITLTVSGTVAASASGTLTNTATVAPPSGTTDPTPGNNSATDTTTITPTADLRLTKTVDVPVPAVGATITYTVTVTNVGPSSATNVAVQDLLPAGVTFSSATPSRGTYNNVTGLWTVGTIANGSSATLQIAAIVTTSSVVTNTAEVSASDQFDPNSTPGNNKPGEDDQASVSIPFSSPRLQLVKRITAMNGVNITTTVDDPGSTNDNAANWPTPVDVTSGISTYLKGVINGGSIKPGDLMEYTVYFLSNGGAAATNINLCDLVPSNSTFVIDSFSSAPESGINLTIGSTSTNLTNVPDADGGQFFNSGATPSVSCSAANSNGAVVVNVVKSPASLPNATAPGTPNNSYGFIRFRARVN